jgi:hypothetical protein
MNFMNLAYETWLKGQNNKPKNSPNIKTEKNNPAYYLSPEDIAAYVNSFSPYDLYMKPDYTPFGMDYPTTAVNIQEPAGYSQEKNVTALFPNSPSYMKYGLNTNWMNSQDEAQGVYVHELAHQKDTRRDPEKMYSFPNHGFQTYQGLNGAILQREFPALVAEERFWDNLYKSYQ